MALARKLDQFGSLSLLHFSVELASWWLPCSTLWDWRLLVALGLAKMSQGWHGVIPPVLSDVSILYSIYTRHIKTLIC